MNRVVELWYEFASTYSYPAVMRAHEDAAALGIQIDLKPFLLGPIFQDQGWTTSPFNLQPAKGAYMWRDLERTCAKLGLAFSKPDTFPQNGLHAARIATALTDQTARTTFTRAVFASQFAEGRNISDPTHLSALLSKSVDNAAEIIEVARSHDNKNKLRMSTEQARQIGIFGAPTWRTSDGELFWGNDRLDDALDWATKSR
ncbi:MAG: 2-hydroxychromene-2-carboxylate isomerase [Pikeienuella sp.]